MKKTNNKSKQILTYVILIGIVAIALVYFFGYKNFTDKAATLRSSNSALSARVTELKGYYETMAEDQDTIATWQEEIKTRLDAYPSDVREEDIIMLAVKSLDTAEAEYTNINMVDPSAILTIPADTVTGSGMTELAGADGQQSDLIYIEKDASYVNKCDYINLKDIINTIRNKPEKNTITNITYTRNDTDQVLEGTIEMAFYYVKGTGKEYTPVDMADYTAGLTDLFALDEKETDTEE